MVISSVDWALITKSKNIENLTLTGDSFVAGIGNRLNNEIIGSNAHNRLSGGAGDDILDGGRGRDRLLGGDDSDYLIGGFGDDLLEGGRGRDRFLFGNIRGGLDNIVDFNPDADFIEISSVGFGGGLENGFLNEAQLLKIPTLDDLTSNFQLGLVYGTSDGNLAYIDTEQGIELTQIAVLQGSPDLNAVNIEIV